VKIPVRTYGGRLAANWSTLRIHALGFLANALGLLTLILILYLCLAIFSLFFTTPSELARAGAADAPPFAGPAWALIGDSLLNSVWNGLRGLWHARLGFLIFGVLGGFAAWAHQIGLMVHRERAWLGSFICMAAIITVSSITWAFAQREEVALWIAESPETFRWRDLLLESYYVEVSVSLVFALSATYLIWAVWRWWYVRLLGWLLPDAQVLDPPDPPRLDHMWQSKKPIKWVSVLFISCLVLLFPIDRYHDRVALHLQHGVAWVDDVNQPERSFVVEVRPGARKIRVVNINGLGTVSIYLSPTADHREAVQSVEDWAFEWRLDEYLYADLPVIGVEPGEYVLHFVQESGWGYFEYTLSDGGGPASHVAALAFGFLLACSLFLGMGLAFLVAVRSKWIDY
jgi:hypothetical protein